MNRRSSEGIRRDFSESLRRYDMEAIQHVLSIFCLLGTSYAELQGSIGFDTL